MRKRSHTVSSDAACSGSVGGEPSVRFWWGEHGRHGYLVGLLAVIDVSNAIDHVGNRKSGPLRAGESLVAAQGTFRKSLKISLQNVWSIVGSTVS